MRHAAILPSLFALLFGLTIACPLPAFAAGYDGEWTVPPPHRATATTDSYAVSVSQGKIVYTSSSP